jgi:hypothetical protein
MNRKSTTATRPQENQSRPTPTVQDLLLALTPKQQQQLEDFARKRLRSLAYSPWLRRYLGPISPEDIVSRAVLKVIVGECDHQAGRPLKPRNRKSADAFMACLQGIMQSDLSNLVTRAEARYEHVPVGNEEPGSDRVDPLDPKDTITLLVLRDLQRVMFAKLYLRAAQKPELLPIIRRWEPNFLGAPRVATGQDDRKLVHHVRKLARQVLWELSQELNLPMATGKEMLL